VIEWAVASRPLAGETESGDSYAVVPFAGGMLLAVTDGLGHGPDAAEASRCAIAAFTASAGPDLASMMQACHQALHRTRGAAAALVAISDDTSELSWLGVGDTAATLVRAQFSTRPSETLLLRPGIIGHTLPRLVVETVQLYDRDSIVMCTDGIRSSYVEALGDLTSPKETANRLLSDYARPYDDALVLVARLEVEDG
jgi:negative regulator of sigma-B (phosphoserine phosphatase)